MYVVTLFLFCLFSCAHSMLDYNETIAKYAVAYSGAAYCYESHTYSVDKWQLDPYCTDPHPDFQVTKTFYNQTIDAYGYVGVSYNDGIIIAAVKGTTPSHLQDWVVDLSDTFSFANNCTLGGISAPAHKGFCNEFNVLKRLGMIDTIFLLFNSNPTFQVFVTGHSLGGAVAHMITLELLLQYNMDVIFYSLGQPRTVGSEFANIHFDILSRYPASAYYRITHYRDVIPHVPPCHTGLNGLCVQDANHPYHSGYQIHYPEDMTLAPVYCNTTDGADCYELFDTSITDHLYYFGPRVSLACCPDASRHAFDDIPNGRHVEFVNNQILTLNN